MSQEPLLVHLKCPSLSLEQWILYIYVLEKNYIIIFFQDILVHQVELALCSPKTNSPLARVFSLMNSIWREEESCMSIDMVTDNLLVKGYVYTGVHAWS